MINDISLDDEEIQIYLQIINAIEQDDNIVLEGD